MSHPNGMTDLFDLDEDQIGELKQWFKIESSNTENGGREFVVEFSALTSDEVERTLAQGREPKLVLQGDPITGSTGRQVRAAVVWPEPQ
jgi:hypothetical protein